VTPVKTSEAVRAKPDAVCVTAVELAREAAVVEAGGVDGQQLVGEYLPGTAAGGGPSRPPARPARSR
jgi:hypothetical protein